MVTESSEAVMPDVSEEEADILQRSTKKAKGAEEGGALFGERRRGCI